MSPQSASGRPQNWPRKEGTSFAGVKYTYAALCTWYRLADSCCYSLIYLAADSQISTARCAIFLN